MKTLFFVFILLSSFLHAIIIDVPIDYLTIQAAIDAAANSDTVLVRSDTYMENINYNGKLITVGSWFLTTQDTIYISQTIIDGNSMGSVVTLNNGEDSTAVLCGFTITNGSATFGGGIYCYNSSASLQNVVISGNTATNGGGIWCIVNSNPSLQNVTISDNSAYHGGGIYCYGSSPDLENVTITGNSATSNGGGIYYINSNPILDNVTISGNTVSDDGGGIYCENSSPILQNVTISGNTAYHAGGGICCYNYSSPSLQNVTISGNSASDHGGGISCSSSSPILENVTITVNSAWYGVGIYCDSSSPSLENVTISGNTAGFYCDGIFCCNDSNPVLINSILWNYNEEIYFSYMGNPNSITISYSDIQGGEAGIVTNSNGTVNWLEGNIDEDPLFVDPGNGDYHLTWANFPIPDSTMSPCIDTGDPASPLDPDGTIADMGAYYFHQTITPDPPQNVTIEIVGTDVHLSWGAVTGANSYKVYASDDPYTGFDSLATVTDTTWSTSIMEVKKFYYVKASTETIRSKDSDSQDAYHYGRKSRRYESDKFIKKKRN